ncbi:DUF5655 domain-containing protein [Candidatus Omnitrophota bacterium]
MSLFKIENKKLKSISEKDIKKEKDLQSLVENNLDEVFSLQFVKSEFAIQDLRIDTLAFDQESKAFVIVEYKRDKSFSVVDQGFAYLSLMLNNKADFILEYNERLGATLRKADVDWEQSRVLFVAQSFTSYQRRAIEFRDLPIELWEARLFASQMISINQIKSSNTTASIKSISNKSPEIQKISKEVRSYTVDDHFKDGWSQSRELFDAISNRLLELDSRIEENAVKSYVGFRIGRKNFASIHMYKSKIRLYFSRTELKDLKDPEGKLAYEKDCMKRFNQHLSYIDIHNDDDADYAYFLAKQAYKRFEKIV